MTLQKITTICVISIICLFLQTHFVYAQNSDPDQPINCQACGATPAPMQNYIDFVEEVLGTIGTINPQVPWLGNYSSPAGMFSEGLLQTNVDRRGGSIFSRLYQGMKRDLRQKMQGIGAVTSIFTNLITANPGQGFAIIFRSSAIIRDRRKLLTLDKRISDTLYEVGIAGASKDEITTIHRARLTSIMERYQNEGDIFADNGVSISNGATYGDLLKILRKINNKHKTFLSIKTIGQFGDQDDVKEIGRGSITIIFGSDYGENLRNTYACSNIVGACTTSFVQFQQAMQTIGNNFGLAARDSGNQIKEAVIRLQKALQGAVNRERKISQNCSLIKNAAKGTEEWVNKDTDSGTVTTIRYITPKNGAKPYREKSIGGGSSSAISETEAYKICKFTTFAMGADPQDQKDTQAFLEREKQLLATQYGIYVKDATIDKSIRGQGKNMLERNRTSLQESEENTRKENSTTGIDKQAKKDQKADSNKKKSIIKDLQAQSYTIDAGQLDSLEIFENTLTNSINGVIDEHRKATAQVTAIDPRPIMLALGKIVQQVRYSSRVVGDRSYTKSIVNNLGKACDLQCSNLGGKCRSD